MSTSSLECSLHQCGRHNLISLEMMAGPLMMPQGFYLGFRDIGTCGTISRVRVYYKVCPSKVEGLTFYPSLPLPAENSQEPNIAYAYCAYNSYNSLASGYKAYSDGRCEYGARCVCKPGYEEVGIATTATCQACSRGKYRSLSDTSCQMCPSNTVRSGVAAAECPCLVNYYRAPNEGPRVGCTTPPSTCLNLAVDHSSDVNGLTVTWNRPNHPGRGDYYYNVYYSSSGEPGTFIQHNQSPYVVKDYKVSYTLSDLSPFTSYIIRVTVHNGVSDQDPTGVMNRSCEVTIATFPNDVAQLEMLSGMALWRNVTDGSTQYQIRYNKTEGYGDDDNNRSLEVCFIDSDSKFTIEVQPLNGGDTWSRPVIVQLKAMCSVEPTTSEPTYTELNSTEKPLDHRLSTHDQCESTELYSYYRRYNYFEDPCAVSIQRIVITHFLHHVSSIAVTYNLANGSTYTAPRRGYDFGRSTVRNLDEINFEEGEEIVAITGAWCAQYDFNDSPLTWFKLITMKPNGDHRVYGPYGGGPVRGEHFVVNANVVAFFGYEYTRGAVYGLGFKYRPN